MNEKLKEKTGYTVKFEYIDRTQYDLKFAAGDSFELSGLLGMTLPTDTTLTLNVTTTGEATAVAKHIKE